MRFIALLIGSLLALTAIHAHSTVTKTSDLLGYWTGMTKTQRSDIIQVVKLMSKEVIPCSN